jgi:mono/diheme cytochrome c family protein
VNDKHLLIALCAAAALAAACDKNSSASSGPIGAEAQKVWTERCVTCHGDTGNGDGPGAAALDPKPRKFGDPTWQDSVTDDQIKKTIVAGGLAVGKSAVMAANPDLKGKDQVLNDLVKKVRSFKK